MKNGELKASYDVVVAGGGPAGSATAHYLAKKGLSVAIIERSFYEKWRVGETLPPQICRELTRLGLWTRFLSQGFASSVEMRWSWGEEVLLEHNFLLNPYGQPWHVDRQQFDQMLLGLASESGVDCALRTAIRSVRQSAGRWRLKLANEGGDTVVDCFFLVDATGQGASVARMLGTKRLRFDNMIGAIGICRLTHAPDPILLVEAVKNGWWYSVPFSPRRLLVGFMTDGDILGELGGKATTRWLRELAASSYTAKRAGALELVSCIQNRPASTGLLEEISGPGWLAVGDAASAYDPISGAGIAKALHFARPAAAAIASALDQGCDALLAYASTVKRDFVSFLTGRLDQYIKEQRWSESPFWERRHKRLSVTQI